MHVNIKRIDTSLPLPQYETSGAVAFDVCSREDMTIAPRTLGFVPTNLIIQVPEGYVLALTLRSSSPKRKGFLIPHGFGIIDQDYCGPTDEILFQLYNFTAEPVPIARGERVGQGTFLSITRASWHETDLLGESSRGGFGSTGS